MVNLSKLTKAELQSTGFKKYQHRQKLFKRYIKTKAQKFNKEGLINKLTSEFNKFKNFGIDLNEANKTANKAKLATKKAENIVKKGKQDLKDIKNKDKEKAGKKINKFIKNSNFLKNYTTNNGILQDLLKLLKFIIIQILEGKHIHMKLKKKTVVFIKVLKMRLLKNLRKRCS